MQEYIHMHKRKAQISAWQRDRWLVCLCIVWTHCYVAMQTRIEKLWSTVYSTSYKVLSLIGDEAWACSSFHESIDVHLDCEAKITELWEL